MELRNCPIDVISVCSSAGEIRPLRFRIEDKDHQVHRVIIDEVVSIRRVDCVGIEAHIFLCRAAVSGRQRMFELKYSIRSHSWCLARNFY